MGATIAQEHGYLEARADRLKGSHIVFDNITVTGTEDLLMAAVLAEGETLVENCAGEPEVSDLAALLIAMGAKIEGAGTATIRLLGVNKLHGARHRINPDRIEAGSFLIAGAITGGDLVVANCQPAHLSALTAKLEAVGIRIDSLGPESLRVRSEGNLRAVDISTEVYLGLPTDIHAQFMALVTQAEGTSMAKENIFDNRFMHVGELIRMGPNIKVEGRTAIVRGKTPLSAAAVMCSDLRASASLILAALVADGESILDRVYHADRGYERLTELPRREGAHVSLPAALKDFPAKLYGVRAEGASHSAWEVLEHIGFTLHDLLDYSTNPGYLGPSWPDDYWPKSSKPDSNQAWQQSMKAMQQDLRAFEDLIEIPDSNLYTAIPWAKQGQTLLHEVLLAADHTSYHTGELAPLR
jgi:hypothetical protein